MQTCVHLQILHSFTQCDFAMNVGACMCYSVNISFRTTEQEEVSKHEIKVGLSILVPNFSRVVLYSLKHYYLPSCQVSS